jgi:hypothetical protein
VVPRGGAKCRCVRGLGCCKWLAWENEEGRGVADVLALIIDVQRLHHAAHLDETTQQWLSIKDVMFELKLLKACPA